MYLLTLSWNNHPPPEGSLYLRISLEHNKRKTISNWWAPTCQAFPTHFILFDFPPLFANLSPRNDMIRNQLIKQRGSDRPTQPSPRPSLDMQKHAEHFTANGSPAIWVSPPTAGRNWRSEEYFIYFSDSPTDCSVLTVDTVMHSRENSLWATWASGSE